MHNTLITLILAGLAALFILVNLNRFRNYIENNCDKNTEQFIDKYYHWDWNDPDTMTLINQINNKSNCDNCTYSMSCDFTDDAQAFCYKSLDIPKHNKKNKFLQNNAI